MPSSPSRAASPKTAKHSIQKPCQAGGGKLAGARRGSAERPYSHVSRPVSRVLDGMRTFACVTAIPLGRRLPGASSNLPGRPDLDIIPRHMLFARASCRPYSVLLPVGFTMPPALPPARCALTAPFHPYRGIRKLAAAVCFLWHFPWVRTRRMLSGTACPRSPDFPPRQPFGFAGAAVRPTDPTGMGIPKGTVKCPAQTC
jgi:hypothetical protein